MIPKLQKKDILNVFMLIACVVVLMLVYTRFKFIYGSVTDWETQHSVIPDYFRELFYETKKVFPSFAPNIGAGQNIYYLSYYGFLSPVILFSYLLPAVSMQSYIIASSIFMTIAGVVLVYIWLRERYDERISFISAFLYSCACPLIFHSHRHIMFVIYLPFVILALICIDRWFNTRKVILFPVLIFLTVMTSYFFSFSALIFITIYAAAVYFETTKVKIFSKEFLKNAGGYIFLALTGVMMAGVLLLPTIYVLLSGRGVQGAHESLVSMMLPGFNLNDIIYSPYSVGVTFAGLAAFVSGAFSENIRIRILSFTILLPSVFSVFIFLLNGTLYVDGKVMIPFLPLAAMLISHMFEQLAHRRFRKYIIPAVALWALCNLIFKDFLMYVPFFLVDAIVTLLSVLWICKKGLRTYRAAPIMLAAFMVCVFANSKDIGVLKKDQNCRLCRSAAELIGEINKSDDGIYRTSSMVHQIQNVNKVNNMRQYQTTIYSSAINKDYHDFYFDQIGNETRFRNSSIMASSLNVMYNIYMGNKYLVSSVGAPVGYKKKKENNGVSLYENADVFPMIYASDEVMSLREYETLSFPQRAEATLKYSVIDDNSIPDSCFESGIQKWNLDYTVLSENGADIRKNDGVYTVNNKKDSSVSLKLKQALENKLIFIRFYVDNTDNTIDKDVFIKINQIKNKLTVKDWKYYNDNEWFEYVISSNEAISSIDMVLSEGSYKISEIEAYTLDYDKISDICNAVDTMYIDSDKTSGDMISGTINVTRDGYLQTSFPYDRGFKLYIDGREHDIEKIDKAFVGTRISKGSHEIKCVFRAPFQTAGLICSATGAVMLIIAAVYVARRRHRV